MARKRSSEHDWICTRCEAPIGFNRGRWKHCGPAPTGHGPGKACGKPPRPMLRRDWLTIHADLHNAAVAALSSLRG